MKPLNQEILEAIILVVNTKDNRHRHWTKMYKLMLKHPQLYVNQDHKFPNELFQEGFNMAWAEFNQEKIKSILYSLEKKGITISITNANTIISYLIAYLNRMTKNKTIDIWRKETYIAA